MKTLCSMILPRIPEINIYELLVISDIWNLKVIKLWSPSSKNSQYYTSYVDL